MEQGDISGRAANACSTHLWNVGVFITRSQLLVDQNSTDNNSQSPT